MMVADLGRLQPVDAAVVLDGRLEEVLVEVHGGPFVLVDGPTVFPRPEPALIRP